MTAINKPRVLLGAIGGGVVWTILSFVINGVLLKARYEQEKAAGHFLATPRYSWFPLGWIVMLFVLAWVVAILYAAARSACGPGPKTALGVGMMVGFASGFPGNFAMATWSPLSRMFPLCWMIEMWLGAVLAALVAGWLYREPAAA
jgi:hypothetical protein